MRDHVEAARFEASRRVLVVAVVGGSLGALGMALSCIPDLPPDPPPAGSGAACGDGYIDLSAGEECDPGAVPATGECSSTCKVVCSGLKWSHNDHCYEFQGTARLLKTEGVNACANSGKGHVVTFASEREFEAGAGFAQRADAASFWVGLWQDTARFNSVVTNEPGWAPSCSGCYAHTSTPDAPLPRAALLAADAAAGCVAGYSDGVLHPAWVQVPCDVPERIPVLCEREPVGTHSSPCDGGVCIDLVYTRAAKRYVYEARPLSASAAEDQCKALGGTLVVLESRDEREQLWHELSGLDTPPDRIWIGLSAGDGSPASWTWDDGTSADAYPAAWGVGEPVGTTRAFLDYQPTTKPVDNTLARSNPQVVSLPSVCQIARTDAGP